ncbi:MAG TPA: CU044_2847 family protein [Ktedonobacteraceae bacterium]|nr:CU044_2847 family protein [Ktedonobacteraceae bacterium]
MSEVENIKAELPNGSTLHIQTVMLGGEEPVADLGLPSFKNVTDAIEGIATSVVDTLKKVKPNSATVEFGVEIGMESGQLTALLVKGTGTATLKITLQWGEISAGSNS